jgi:hypothetical protein
VSDQIIARRDGGGRQFGPATNLLTGFDELPLALIVAIDGPSNRNA